MVGAIIAIGVCGVVSAIGEKLTEDERTKDYIRIITGSIAGTIVVVTIVHVAKEVIKVL